MFDIGVNLASSRFRNRDQMICTAQESLMGIISISNSASEWNKNIGYCSAWTTPQFLVKTTIGIHPHHAHEATFQNFIDLEHLAARPEVVAIGECGLDFDRMFSTKEQQIDVFRRQIYIAQKVNKPLYLHVRDGREKAMGLFVEIMLDARTRYPHLQGIVHCFTSGPSELETILQLGLYFGVTGWVCDERRNRLLRNALLAVPPKMLLECILFETDAPYLTPPEFAKTNKINQPHAVWEVVEYVSNLLQVDKQTLVQASVANTKTLFSLV